MAVRCKPVRALKTEEGWWGFAYGAILTWLLMRILG